MERKIYKSLFTYSSYRNMTIKDPLKRETAKKNGLNWMEVFTSDINVLIDKVKDLL